MNPQHNEVGPSGKSKGPVVFSIVRDSQCSECGKALFSGDFLHLEGGMPLCLGCADFDHLVYLPRGDAALSRRARKHSSLSAVVVRFSRSRSRYERQGLLVEEAALARAEDECLADAEKRAAQRKRGEARRATEDRDLVERMTEAILREFPSCPEAQEIAAHTSVRNSGRVGRSAAGRALDPEALTAAVMAHIRHRHTCYDDLLMAGYDRADARAAVRGDIDEALERWRAGGPTGGGH